MVEKFARIRVTSTQDYFLTLPESSALTLEQQITDWFKDFNPNRFHPQREGSVIQHTKKFKDIKVLSQGELKDA